MTEKKQGVELEVGFEKEKKNPLFRLPGKKFFRPALYVAGLVLLTVVLFLVIRSPRPESKARVLVSIDGEVITTADFMRQFEDLPDYYRAYVKENRSQFLRDMVDRELIYRQARRSPLARSEKLRARVRDYEKDLLVNEFVRREITGKMEFSEADLRFYYEQNPDDFVSPEGVNVSVILVPDESRARNILGRISDGDDFHELAREYSAHPSRLQGGDLGLLRRGDIAPEIEEIVFELEPGESAGPIESNAGYYLVKVTSFFPERRMSFEEAIPEIRRRYSGVREEEHFRDYVRQLRSKSRIEVNHEILEKMSF